MSASKTNDTFNAGHRQRLKTRFLHDPAHTEDYELLEILLGYAIMRKDTKPLAKRLLKHFGSLRRVLDAKQEELLAIDGLGMGVWTLWQVLHQCMARHAFSEIVDKAVLATPENIAAAAQKYLANQSVEECWIALLDKGGHCIRWQMLARGIVDTVAVTSREVFAAVFAVKACQFILVHNHPGGSPVPSKADLALTAVLRDAAQRLGVTFVEHIIITDHRCRSLLSGQDVIPTRNCNH